MGAVVGTVGGFALNAYRFFLEGKKKEPIARLGNDFLTGFTALGILYEAWDKADSFLTNCKRVVTNLVGSYAANRMVDQVVRKLHRYPMARIPILLFGGATISLLATNNNLSQMLKSFWGASKISAIHERGKSKQFDLEPHEGVYSGFTLLVGSCAIASGVTLGIHALGLKILGVDLFRGLVRT